MRKIAIGILSLVIITALASVFIVNQLENDTWDDTHWGGDVGEEEFSQPSKDEETRNGGGWCSGIIVAVVGIPAYYLQRKRKKGFQ